MQDYPEKLCPDTNENISRADRNAVRELVLWTENTRELQEALSPIVKNLARHYLRGSYNPTSAVKACYPVADAAAISYERVFGVNKNASKVGDVTWCTPKDRRAAAYDILGGSKEALEEAIDAQRKSIHKTPTQSQSAEKIKTMQGWEKSGHELYDYLHTGDRVSTDMVQHFRDSLPPTMSSSEFVQAGEPYDRQPNPQNDRLQDTYATFVNIGEASEQWVFAGNCFKGSLSPNAAAITKAHPSNARMTDGKVRPSSIKTSVASPKTDMLAAQKSAKNRSSSASALKASMSKNAMR